MHRSTCLVPLVFLSAMVHASASPADAARIQKSYQVAMEKWSLEMRIAATPADRAKAWSSRPDATPFARDMWEAISPALDKEWTLEPAAWFLTTTPGLLASTPGGGTTAIFAKENEAIRKAIETYHLKSPKLGPVCSALAMTPDPRSLAVLEKVQSSHPDAKIQGVAALGAAMQLKPLGDEGEIMRRRLTYLRKSIIQASDVDVHGTTVAKLAEDELYIIRFLTKGRVAPDLVGVDSGKRPLSLSANKGKVIILLFWNSNVPDAKRLVEFTTAMEAKFKGKPVAIIGVNNDPIEKLRALEADGTVPFKNFSDPENKLATDYRVGTWPLAYVLDAERKVQYAGAPGSFAELTAEALVDKKAPQKGN